MPKNKKPETAFDVTKMSDDVLCHNRTRLAMVEKRHRRGRRTGGAMAWLSIAAMPAVFVLLPAGFLLLPCAGFAAARVMRDFFQGHEDTAQHRIISIDIEQDIRKARAENRRRMPPPVRRDDMMPRRSLATRFAEAAGRTPRRFARFLGLRL